MSYAKEALDEALIGLNEGQTKALTACAMNPHVFLTGTAGTGKSYVVTRYRQYMSDIGTPVPVVAPTGAAAIIVGGQTFHRFFGFNLATNVDALIANALARSEVADRIRNTPAVVIDEVSMLPGYLVDAAYQLCQQVRCSQSPWGGMGVLAVGDFRQLPPVTKIGEDKPWAFLSDAWKNTNFKSILLTEPVRTTHPEFIQVLHDARIGNKTPRLVSFLNDRIVSEIDPNLPCFHGTNVRVDKFNEEKLKSLDGPDHVVFTTYEGHTHYQDALRKTAPIPEKLVFRNGALVMIRQNCPMNRYVNGSVGTIVDYTGEHLVVKLRGAGVVALEKKRFSMVDEYGDELASASNFPIVLAWAATIHKSQGMTLDAATLDLSSLWEPGQLYVALSRMRTPEGVKIVKWDNRAFCTDPAVNTFHENLWKEVNGA